jgi:hypothetical protein
MMCCRRVSVLDANRARNGRAVRPAHRRTHRSPVAGHCGARIRLDVRYHWGRKHLPVVELRRAA